MDARDYLGNHLDSQDEDELQNKNNTCCKPYYFFRKTKKPGDERPKSRDKEGDKEFKHNSGASEPACKFV
mgnify:CR=1 FL=1